MTYFIGGCFLESPIEPPRSGAEIRPALFVVDVVSDCVRLVSGNQTLESLVRQGDKNS